MLEMATIKKQISVEVVVRLPIVCTTAVAKKFWLQKILEMFDHMLLQLVHVLKRII